MENFYSRGTFCEFEDCCIVRLRCDHAAERPRGASNVGQGRQANCWNFAHRFCGFFPPPTNLPPFHVYCCADRSAGRALCRRKLKSLPQPHEKKLQSHPLQNCPSTAKTRWI